MEEKTISIGEFRVRTKFNPSQVTLISTINQKTAAIINMVSEIRDEGEEESAANERRRLVALALTKYEEAAMFAVKAATL